MSQSRRLSALEAVANVAIGWGIALAVQLAAFPVMGLQAQPWQHIALSAVFTLVSLIRSYTLRRLFARLG